MDVCFLLTAALRLRAGVESLWAGETCEGGINGLSNGASETVRNDVLLEQTGLSDPLDRMGRREAISF